MSQLSLEASRFTRNFITHPTVQRIIQSDLAKLITNVSLFAVHFFYSNSLLFCISLGLLDRSIANHGSDEKTLRHKIIIDIRNLIISIGLYHALSSSLIKNFYASMPLLLKFTFVLSSFSLQGFLAYRIIKNGPEQLKELIKEIQSEDKPPSRRGTPSPDPLRKEDQPPNPVLTAPLPFPVPTQDGIETALPRSNLPHEQRSSSEDEASTADNEESNTTPVEQEAPILGKTKPKARSTAMPPRPNKQARVQPLQEEKAQRTKQPPVLPRGKKRGIRVPSSLHRGRGAKVHVPGKKRSLKAKGPTHVNGSSHVKRTLAAARASHAINPNIQKTRRFNVICRQAKQHFVVKHECHLHPETFFKASQSVESILKALRENDMPSSPIITQALQTLTTATDAVHRIGQQQKIDNSSHAQRAIAEFNSAIDALQKEVAQALSRASKPAKASTQTEED